jgi:hypothetical protein
VWLRYLETTLRVSTAKYFCCFCSLEKAIKMALAPEVWITGTAHCCGVVRTNTRTDVHAPHCAENNLLCFMLCERKHLTNSFQQIDIKLDFVFKLQLVTQVRNLMCVNPKRTTNVLLNLLCILRARRHLLVFWSSWLEPLMRACEKGRRSLFAKGGGGLDGHVLLQYS